WSGMLPYGLAASLILLLVGWRRENPALVALRDEIGDSTPATGMGQLLIGSFLGLGAIGLLSWMTVLTPSQAAMILIPLASACMCCGASAPQPRCSGRSPATWWPCTTRCSSSAARPCLAVCWGRWRRWMDWR